MLAKICMCIVFYITCVGCRMVSVRGLVCKDPDDGTLHAVNTTWRSSSFCGNYTCRMRTKDDNNKVSLKILNITETIHLNGNQMDQMNEGSENNYVFDRSHIETKSINLKHKEHLFKAQNKDDAKLEELVKNVRESVVTSLADQQDRYLNEEEINTITKLLRTVKKSDLEALIEIYSLAKDIYREIDNDERAMFRKTNNHQYPMAPTNAVSYFYEPMLPINEKDLKTTDRSNTRTSTMLSTQPPPNIANQKLPPTPFEKIPYYYSFSNYHRTPYYYNPYRIPNFQSTYKPPCHYQYTNQRYPAKVPSMLPKLPVGDSQKIKPQLTLIGFPFNYLYKNALTDNFYFQPWTQFSMKPVKQSSENPSFVELFPIPNLQETTEIVDNDRDINNIEHEIEQKPLDNQDLLMKNTESSKDENTQPIWKTKALAPQLIEEIKANIGSKPENLLLKLPFRKQIKLEKVGKVSKMEENVREKREAELLDASDDKLEVYIEKTICEATTEMGFFRHGDSNLPYPHCCPQKIES